MKPCTFLDVDNCGNVDMKPVSTRVNWSGASRGLRTKGRTASIHCRPAPPRQTEALSSRTSRPPPLETAQQSGERPKDERAASVQARTPPSHGPDLPGRIHAQRGQEHARPTHGPT